MNFPLRIADQLQPHLRALRKRRGLTQAQLGALVGVKQARIAEIEANPGAVSLEQITKLLAALGGALHLHVEDAAEPAPRGPVTGAAKTPVKTARTQKRPEPSPAARTVTIPAKKGIW